jgi:hypothetical protein
MRRLAAFRVTSGVVCIAAMAGVVAAPAQIAAPPAGPPLAPRNHGFMLYLTQPLGGGSSAAIHPKFGFRVEQVRMTGNSGAPDGGDPVQHRALVGWQMDGLHIRASDMKVDLGDRMTYDVTHGAFGAQTVHTSASSPSRAATTNRDTSTESRPFSPQLFEPSLSTREGFRQSAESSAMVHDIAAAAIGTFKLSRPVQVQQRTFLGPRPSSMRDGG